MKDVRENDLHKNLQGLLEDQAGQRALVYRLVLVDPKRGISHD